MDHFRECFDRQVAATDELLRNFLTGPAPKEKEMNENHPVIGRLMDVAEKAVCDAARTAERRALARDAYMSALGGLCAGGNLNVTDTAGGAAVIALETVRRWDTFMAAVDAEGGE